MYRTGMPGHSHPFDLLVIGAGSAGVRASRVAASLGARVAIVESGALGGTCVNLGCIPKKLMVYGAHFHDEVEEAAAFGWSVGKPVHDWRVLIANKDREIARLNGVYQKLLEDRGVRILRGRAVLRGPHEVDVHAADGVSARHGADRILVATGGRPIRPRIEGSELAMVSDDVFHLGAMPRRLLVQGGGYIAVELAGVFHGYGAKVTLAHRGPLFLRGFDRDVRTHLDAEMRKKGIDLRFHHDLARIERTAEGALRVSPTSGEALEVDAVLAAIGRTPNTAGLGLAEVGVSLDRDGAIQVDETFRTSVPSIYAVGDVVARIQLTPVALAEGSIVARNLYGGADVRADYRDVPSAVFSSPPVGTVGLTEEEARAELGGVDVYRSVFTPLKATMTGGTQKTLMKIIVERATDRVVGVHVVGADASEIIQGFAVAMKCGATKAQLDATIGIHPTAAEELVTMREPIAHREQEPLHGETPRERRIVHHRWADVESRS